MGIEPKSEAWEIAVSNFKSNTKAINSEREKADSRSAGLFLFWGPIGVQNPLFCAPQHTERHYKGN
jgi:hypothetical protein